MNIFTVLHCRAYLHSVQTLSKLQSVVQSVLLKQKMIGGRRYLSNIQSYAEC